MGRGRGRGGGGRRQLRRDFGKGDGNNVWQENRTRVAAQDDYQSRDTMCNEQFEEYYQQQGIVPDGEWDDFIASLKKQLPVTFRINGTGRFANEIRNRLTSDFFSHFDKGQLTVDGESVSAPRPLPWYPNNLAWHMDFSRNQLRKLGLLDEIHKYLVRANEAGTISRQEAVSMIPPLLLDVQPTHRVLDMCAAPGSKTLQLLEALHACDTEGSSPSGFVVANDADFQRCNLLVHQTKRVCSPSLMVTNHEAQEYPLLRALPAAAAPDAAAAAAPDAAAAAVAAGEPMLFDRILCDVPCSGDGTLRKAPDIWRRWKVDNGNSLHLLQLRIAIQAVKLLKVGGRMVYSTCTFNPIEDEAVVAELLVRCKGALRLLDVSDRLPELKRMPGLRRWRVRDRFRWYDSWQQAADTSFKVDPSMFSDEQKAQLPMERCMRVLPHHQDTGGFFICALEKVAETPDLQMPTTAHRHALPGEAGNAAAGGGAAAAALSPEEVLAGAAAAAAAAVAEAERAISAVEAGDVATAASAAAAAAAAANRVDHANRLAKQQAQARQKQETQAARQAAQAAGSGGAAAMETDGPAADGVKEKDEGDEDGASMDSDGGGAAAGDSDGEAAAGEGAESGDDGGDAAAEAGTSAPAKALSWVRGGGGRGRMGGRFKFIDPVAPVEDPRILDTLRSYYGISDDFALGSQLITRNIDSTFPKKLYFVTRPVLDVLLADRDEKLKITSTGLKVFERQDMKDSCGGCFYRISQDGLPFLLPYVTRQRVQMRIADFVRLLKDRTLPIPNVHPPASDGAAAGTPAAADNSGGAAAEAASNGAAGAPAKDAGPVARARSGAAMLDEPSFLAQLRDVKLGCFVVEVCSTDAKALGLAAGSEASGALTANAPLAIVSWRTRASVGVLVAKPECQAMLDKIAAAQRALLAASTSAEAAAAPQ